MQEEIERERERDVDPRSVDVRDAQIQGGDSCPSCSDSSVAKDRLSDAGGPRFESQNTRCEIPKRGAQVSGPLLVLSSKCLFKVMVDHLSNTTCLTHGFFESGE